MKTITAIIARSGEYRYDDYEDGRLPVQHRPHVEVQRMAELSVSRPVRLDHDGAVVGHVTSAWVCREGATSYLLAQLRLDDRGLAAVASGYRECSPTINLGITPKGTQHIYEVLDVALVRAARGGRRCRVLDSAEAASMRGELKPMCRLKPGQTSADCPAGSAGDHAGRADIGDLMQSPEGREVYFAALERRYADERAGVSPLKYAARFLGALQPHLDEIDRARAARKDNMSNKQGCKCSGKRRDDIDPDDLDHRAESGSTAAPWRWTPLPADASITEVKERLATFGAGMFADAEAKREAFEALIARARAIGLDQLADTYSDEWRGRLDHDLAVDEQVAMRRAQFRDDASIAARLDAEERAMAPSPDDDEATATAKANARNAVAWTRPWVRK